MNTKIKQLGAAALLCITVAVAVYALHIHVSVGAFLAFISAMGIIGSTVTYLTPGSTTTPATAAQAANVQSQAMTVNFDDSDTTATITHNFQASTYALALLRPWVQVYAVTTGTAYPALTWALGANTLVITKVNTGTGSGGTYNVIIQRPWTPLCSNVPSMP
jgi:hypothetical protein